MKPQTSACYYRVDLSGDRERGYYGVRRGCVPVLGSFGLEIVGLGYAFTGEFL